MITLCHRCGGDLPPGVVFCPHCGAPQLLLPEEYLAEPQPHDAAVDSTGVLPPPLPRQVDWQTALRSAGLVAAVGALLCVIGLRVPGISFVSTLWILTASTTTLALYLHRRPNAWMDAAVGARIGAAAGLALVVFIAASMAVSGLVARFGLHAMGGFDSSYAQMIQQVKQTARETATASGTPAPPELLRLYDIPEFQAGLLLTSIAIGSALLFVFTALGGALNGILRQRSRMRL